MSPIAIALQSADLNNNSLLTWFLSRLDDALDQGDAVLRDSTDFSDRGILAQNQGRVLDTSYRIAERSAFAGVAAGLRPKVSPIHDREIS